MALNLNEKRGMTEKKKLKIRVENGISKTKQFITILLMKHNNNINLSTGIKAQRGIVQHE